MHGQLAGIHGHGFNLREREREREREEREREREREREMTIRTINPCVLHLRTFFFCQYIFYKDGQKANRS